MLSGGGKRIGLPSQRVSFIIDSLLLRLDVAGYQWRLAWSNFRAEPTGGNSTLRAKNTFPILAQDHVEFKMAGDSRFYRRNVKWFLRSGS
jgi:hypothetical protein